MKWFKHESNSIHEAELEKLIQKYGIEGYGLYYACIELIAQRLTGDNVDFELHHDAETLAIKFKVDTLRVEEIMKYCVKAGLFQYNVETKNIVCMRLVKMLDISTSNNPEIKNILSDPKYKNLLESNNRLDYITLDQNREDKNKSKRGASARTPTFIKPLLQDIKDYILEAKLENIDADQFYDYYEANGWHVGKQKMINWKAAARNWSRRSYETKPKELTVEEKVRRMDEAAERWKIKK